MQPEFEARPEVVELPAGYSGEIVTNCHAIRIRNRSTTAPLTLNVSGMAFKVAAGKSWGMDTGDVRTIIQKSFEISTGSATALVERVFLSKI
ncbi:hypothetical protein Q5H93_02995 [Hymenobacter sp. ASUV-10]|uniref:Uncharacterized protein n=1 Tax=Hymenobacter aranciens TaxID=3063996 RepID=A0ABT9BAG6_9BACT|nr:hypothetical protein [Hymenobacter sp. ASUV-10]MDO7873686.1 hypothetical protein [Hymenobacter sp. ASUV-10]